MSCTPTKEKPVSGTKLMVEKLYEGFGFGWTKERKDGTKFLSCVLKAHGGQIIHLNIKKNPFKRQPTHPDWVLTSEKNWKYDPKPKSEFMDTDWSRKSQEGNQDHSPATDTHAQ
jgi:hypothetical protein